MKSILLSIGINIDMYNAINSISKQSTQTYNQTLTELMNIGIIAHSFEQLIKIDHIQSQSNNIIVSCYVEQALNDVFDEIILEAIKENKLPNSVNSPFTHINKSKIINNCIYLAMTIPIADCIM